MPREKWPGVQDEVIFIASPGIGIQTVGGVMGPTTGAETGDIPMALADFPEVEVQPLFPGVGAESMFLQAAEAPAGAPSYDAGPEPAPDEPLKEVPNLARYHTARVSTDMDPEDVLRRVNELPTVEEAYIQPAPSPAVFEEPGAAVGAPAISGVTPDFTLLQRYLEPPPAGIGAEAAWGRPGGRGSGVTIVDIEGSWDTLHEDLTGSQQGIVGGIPIPDERWLNHGTAVIGEIMGDLNHYGITGIASNIDLKMVSIGGSNAANAIRTASAFLRRGDIILIELHAPGPRATGVGQQGYIAMEWWAANFAVIRIATARGIVVIAAAGNGAEDLDHPDYLSRFDPAVRDSGAILAGAGAPPDGTFGPDRSRLGFSNYGQRVNVQGYGRSVVTTGYGTLQGGSDRHGWYTDTFSGTSSASPIIVGAAAVIQGVLKAANKPVLTSRQMRALLENTGSAQQDHPTRPATQKIGPRPNLHAALAALGV